MELILKTKINEFKSESNSLIKKIHETTSINEIDKHIELFFEKHIEGSSLFLERFYKTFDNGIYLGLYVLGSSPTSEEKRMEIENQVHRRRNFLNLFLEIFEFINFKGISKSNIRPNKPFIKKDSFFLLKKLNEINSIEYIPYEWMFFIEGIELNEKNQEDIFKFLLFNEYIETNTQEYIRISWKGKVYLEEFKP